MLFNSFPFWVFFITVFTCHWLLPKKFQNIVLIISSYTFYCFWDWRFLSLIVISTITDFVLAQKIIQYPSRKRAFLFLSLFINLGILSAFKYFGFFIEQISYLLSIIGFQNFHKAFEIILPVGISFYTFQTISYTIDVYNGKIKPINNILEFGLYVSFFPQLVAGPIERANNLLPQFLKRRTLNTHMLKDGFYYIIYGIFLKTVLADNMAIIADGTFLAPYETLVGGDIIIGVYAFAFQIYGDFAGYSLIAIGLGKTFGINLKKNFQAPYLASNPSDFWRRWHISLSRWLRDYLYIPLGGNKNGNLKMYRNLLLTMILGGLWHGAGWTFIYWGTFHGILLVLYKHIALCKLNIINKKNILTKITKVIIMFHLTCISWIFFSDQRL